jgi:hypothetical protein
MDSEYHNVLSVSLSLSAIVFAWSIQAKWTNKYFYSAINICT